MAGVFFGLGLDDEPRIQVHETGDRLVERDGVGEQVDDVAAIDGDVLGQGVSLSQNLGQEVLTRFEVVQDPGLGEIHGVGYLLQRRVAVAALTDHCESSLEYFSSFGVAFGVTPGGSFIGHA